MTDYAGQRYGQLIAIAFDHKASNNAYHWRFMCDCGKEVITNLHDARRGKIQSCGCIKRKLSDEEAGFRRTLQTYRDQAISRGLVWDITNDEARALFKGNCRYCKSPPNNHRQRVYKDRYLDYLYSGIDRVDNNKGYTTDNCVSCCSVCNRMKLNHTESEFLSHIKRIYEVIYGTNSVELFRVPVGSEP